MYTIKIKSVTLKKAVQKVNIIVEFTEGADVFEKTFVFDATATKEHFRETVQRYMNTLDMANAQLLTLVPGSLDLSGVDLNPKLSPEKQAEIDWNVDLNKLRSVEELITLGIIEAAGPEVVALKNIVKAGFKKSYIE